eukprot:gene16877-18582_t
MDTKAMLSKESSRCNSNRQSTIDSAETAEKCQSLDIKEDDMNLETNDSKSNSVRMFCKKVVENKLFEYFILMTIATNCVLLMIATPLPNDDASTLNNRLEDADAVFVAIFTLEAILKIIAYGFIFHTDSYLRSGWNILDFTVVVIGVVQVSSLVNDSSTKRNSESIRVLRAVRVLRPLKLVSGIPSLQVVMKSLIRAMVPLLQILLLVLFVIVIYAIIGLELLRGSFHYTCFRNTSSGFELAVGADEQPRPCDQTGGWGRLCNSGEICRRATETEWRGPNQGITAFDNMFLAMLTVFQCITLEGWSEVLYLTIDAKNQRYSFITWCSFTLLIVIGSFFMLNLVLGVLSGEFAKERERVEKRKSFMKLRRQHKIDCEVDMYLEWISKAEDIILSEDEFESNEGLIHHKDSLDIQGPDVSPGSSTGQLLRKEKKDLKESQSALSTTTKRNCSRKKMSVLHCLKQHEKKVRLSVRKLSKNIIFNWIVLVFVFLNSVTMSLQKYGQDETMGQFLELSEKSFTALFFLEMLLRIYGLGFRVYMNSAFNRFDFAVVWLSIGDLFLSYYKDEQLGIRVLRSFRLLRAFKITRFWRSMQNVVTSLMNSIKSILSLILLLLLFIFIFALLGMQLFGGMFNTSASPARTSFDSFPKAMLAVFQIMTGEDWNTVMYNGISAFGGPQSLRGILASMYFVSLVIIGNYTLLNVFLAIAVDNLANAQALTRDEEFELRRRAELKLARRRKALTGEDKWCKVRAVPKMLILRKKSDTKDNPFSGLTYMGVPSCESSKSLELKPQESSHKDKLHDVVMQYQSQQSQSIDDFPVSPSVMLPRRHLATDRNKEMYRSNKILQRRQYSTTKMVQRRTLFLFDQNNRIRMSCSNMVNMKHFDHVMLIIIILSSILLAMENPLDDHSKINQLLRDIDIAFVSIFALEVIAKIIADGLILHKGSFLRDWWNAIDTFIVACNITAIVLSYQDGFGAIGKEQTLKSMRVLRVFRPLRAVNKLEKLKLVFQCMVFSLKKVVNIIIITLLCLFMFAVVGVHLFQGRFQSCNDVTKLTREECQGNYYTMKDNDETLLKIVPRIWKNYDFNFDKVSNAMLTLFSSATGEGWPQVMQIMIDSTTVDRGPLLDNRIHMSLFYVSFVVVFSFFFLNIFVALIIVTFQERGEKELAGCELTKNQRACLQFVLQAKPRERFMPQDKDGICYKVWNVVDSKPFEIAIMTLIALNAIVLMLSRADESPQYRKILEILNQVFTSLFTLEACFKLCAYKLNYFRDGWNVFDFLIVLMTLIGSVINACANNDFPIDPSFFRLFRAFRLIKLLKQGYNIRVLLWTFLQSFKALPYVMLLILMLFFIYAVIGMQLFGKVKLDPKTQINEFNNFRSFFHSLQVLFRCATGEAWHLVMLACSGQALCHYSDHVKCGSTSASIVYFCSFYFFCSFLLLNLFVAVIMDNFDYLTRDKSILGPHHMDEFVRVWSEYDPSASGRIPHTDIYHLMCDMQPPVGFGKKCPKFLAYKRLMRMNMPVGGDNTVRFRNTLFALVRTSISMTSKDKPCFRDNCFRRIIRKLWPNTPQRVLDVILPELSVLSSQQITIGKIYAAKLIYESFKDMKRRRESCVSTDTMPPDNQQKRGSSILRKMIGAFRTTSHPLRLDLDKRPTAGYLSQRRRSKSFDGLPNLPLNDKYTAVKCVTPDASTKRHQWRSRSLRLEKINDSPDDSLELDEDENACSTISRATAMSALSSKEISPVFEKKLGNSLIADSLITALRDPTKPILCFVNPKLPRQISDGKNATSNNSSSSSCRTGRPRASTLTLSLPMIKLEIPVENEAGIMNMPLGAENMGELLSSAKASPEPIPDLILSTTPTTSNSRMRVNEELSAQSQPASHRPVCRNCCSVPGNFSSYLQLSDSESKDIVLEIDNGRKMHHSDSSSSSGNSDSSKLDNTRSSVRKREYFKNSKRTETTRFVDNGHRPLKKSRGLLKREHEIQCSNSSVHSTSSNDDASEYSRTYLNSEETIANTDCSSAEQFNTSKEKNVELQFLRALNNEITRVAAANQQPKRTTYQRSTKPNEEETWC